MGKYNGKKWSQIWILLLIKGVKSSRKQSFIFNQFCLLAGFSPTRPSGPSWSVSQHVRLFMLRSQILGSFESTKTNEVNLHGFCTNSILKWLRLGLRVYECKKNDKKCKHSIGRTLVQHVFCQEISKKSVRENWTFF